MSRANPAYNYHRQRYLLLQSASKRSQLLPTSHYSLVLPLILLSSYYQLHTTINFISSILLPTIHLLLITTSYSLLPTIYLPTTLFLSFSIIYCRQKFSLFYHLPIYCPTYCPTYFLSYHFAPLLPAALLTTHNYYYLPTTPKLYYPSTFFFISN